jgi:hypothetical protein
MRRARPFVDIHPIWRKAQNGLENYGRDRHSGVGGLAKKRQGRFCLT